MDFKKYGEYEKKQAWQKLKSELDAGRRSGEENGWVSAEEVRVYFEEKWKSGYENP